MVVERFKENHDMNVSGRRSCDGCMYNLPTSPNVAALIVSMLEFQQFLTRDIIYLKVLLFILNSFINYQETMSMTWVKHKLHVIFINFILFSTYNIIFLHTND